MVVITSVKLVFKKYPLLQNCITYGSFCLGAEFSQQFVKKRILHPQTPLETIDIEALKRYAVYGYVICPNILHFWYKWLDRQFGVLITAKTIARKVVLGQFLLTPVCFVVFYTSMSLMEKKSDILAECKEKFVPTFLTHMKFWIPVNIINFWLIPAPLRFLYLSCGTFIWGCVLCSLKERKLECPENGPSVNNAVKQFLFSRTPLFLRANE